MQATSTRQSQAFTALMPYAKRPHRELWCLFICPLRTRLSLLCTPDHATLPNHILLIEVSRAVLTDIVCEQSSNKDPSQTTTQPDEHQEPSISKTTIISITPYSNLQHKDITSRATTIKRSTQLVNNKESSSSS